MHLDIFFKYIQLLFLAVFLGLFLGKTFYIKKKLGINAFLPGLGKDGKKAVFEVLSFIFTLFFTFTIIFYVLSQNFISYIEPLKIEFMDNVYVKASGLLIIITGFILVDLGNELMSILVKSYNLFPLYVSSIIHIIGILISASPAFLDQKYFVNKQKFWKILSVLVIVAYFIVLFLVYLYIGVATFLIYTIIMSIATYLLTLYFIINNI